MAYELRPLRRYKARYNDDNNDNLLTVCLVVDGAKVALATGDTATITVYTPDGETAIETATAMTVTDGEANVTVALDTSADTTNYTVRESYRGDITITASSVEYKSHVVFDVVNYVLKLLVTSDQLLDREDSLRGSDWGGDEDFSGIIEACRDELQIMLEGTYRDQGQMLEDMHLDHNKLATVQRVYILSEIFFAKGDTEKGERFERKFKSLYNKYFAQVRADVSQSGTEESKPIRHIKQRFYT